MSYKLFLCEFAYLIDLSIRLLRLQIKKERKKWCLSIRRSNFFCIHLQKGATLNIDCCTKSRQNQTEEHIHRLQVRQPQTFVVVINNCSLLHPQHTHRFSSQSLNFIAKFPELCVFVSVKISLRKTLKKKLWG
jgi:hypothetical protein